MGCSETLPRRSPIFLPEILPRTRSSKHCFMLKFVLLTLLVGSVPCLLTKREVDDDKQEVDVTDSGERAEIHNREPSRAFQTNAGQDSGNETYSQLRETAEDQEVNVDGADEGASNNVGKTTGGSVPRRMIDDRMLTAYEHELDASERGEWSGWATPEVPALFDAQDRKEKQNRNRRRKSTSGYGRKSDIVLSTSFGKEVGEDNKKDKGQALMLLDREAEASGAKKTAVATQLLQYIGIPISFAIALAACAWTGRLREWWQRCWHGEQPVDDEAVPILRNEEQRSTAGTTREMATDNAETSRSREERHARNVGRTEEMERTGKDLATGVLVKKPGTSQRKMTEKTTGKMATDNAERHDKEERHSRNAGRTEEMERKRKDLATDVPVEKPGTSQRKMTAETTGKMATDNADRHDKEERHARNAGRTEEMERMRKDLATDVSVEKPGTSQSKMTVGTTGKMATGNAETKRGRDEQHAGKSMSTGVQRGKPGSSEEDAYKITEQLAQYNDLELRGVTESYQEQLELAIKDVVEHISELLIRKWRMSEINLEEIRTLIRNNQRSDASEHILESVLDGDTGNCRMFWNVLFELQTNPQYLMKLLTQDVEIDVKHRHRCQLRNRSRKLNLTKPRLISDIYIEPTITVIPGEHENLTGEPDTHIREVKHHELFKQSNRDSDMSKISIVHGAAGTGKTTLIQKLIYDWATGAIYEEFSFVLHFKIQKLNEVKCNITLSRLIVDTYPYLESYLDHLWNEPKRLLFIFDDLDQLYLSQTLSDTGRNSDPRYRCTDTESEHLVCDIVRCLLQGDILRGCSVLITNRVWNLELLHHIAADSTFQVMGFTYEKAKEYFRRYLRNGQNANEIVEFIEQNDLLWNMCRDPLFCVILASSLESFQAEGEGQKSNLVISHTKVLSEYVTHLLGKCGYDGNTNRKFLRVVGKLADKGIGQNALSLEGEALRDLDSCPPVFISAFMYQDPAKQSGGVTYEFRHPVLRDFLAALTNVLNAPISRLTRNLDERFADVEGRFITFSIFLVGLSCRKSTDRLELELHTFPIEVTSSISELLRESVTRHLKDMDRDCTQKMFRCLLYCLFEFGDNEITKEVLNSITTIKLNHLQLKSPDRIVLSRTLISPEVIQELDLSSCFAQTEEIWKLEQLLHRCVILRLNQNNLQDSGVKRLFHVLKKSKIKTLSLKSNNLTDNCLESVFVALTTNPTLLQLNLSNSSQDGKQANRFTDEKLQYHHERFAQQKEIKWLRIKCIGQELARSVTQSNSLTLITD